MKPVLLTGFEPFGGETRNPSRDIALALDGTLLAGHPVIGAELPCVFGASADALCALIRRHDPGLVLCLGVALGRTEITPERVAINLDDAPIPDTAGAQPINREIVPGGPVGYWSGLPVEAMVAALQAGQVPARISPSAGTFVCNHVFYALMHALAERPGSRGGFVHVPMFSDEWSLERLIRGISLATIAALTSFPVPLGPVRSDQLRREQG